METVLRSNFTCKNLIMKIEMYGNFDTYPSCKYFVVKKYEKFVTAHCNSNNKTVIAVCFVYWGCRVQTLV